MEKEEIKSLLIDDEYEPVLTEEEAQELKPILGAFVGAYIKNVGKERKEWLPQKIKESLPEISDEEANQIFNDMEVSLNGFDVERKNLKLAKKAGKTRDSWLAEQIEKATSGMSREASIKYLSGLDGALVHSNTAKLNTVTTKAGTINQNPSLDGFIAERYHAETFNLNAQARGSEYRAKVLEPAPGERYGRNSVDIVIVDGEGKIVPGRRYQVKYYKDAEATEGAFKKGDYRGQRSLVPSDQAEDINRNVTTVLEAPDGTTSEPLSKAEAKELQERTQSGELVEFDWSNYNSKDLAKQIGKQAGYSCLQGAAIAVGFDIAHKLYNGEKIEAEKEIEKAIESGADFGLKSAAGSALKVASEKGFLKFIPKGTPASVCANIAFVGVENAKVLTKVAAGDLTPREGMEEMADVSASTVGGLISMSKGMALGAKGGGIVGTAIGTYFGGPAGAVLGMKLGSTIGGFIGGSISYMAGSKVGHAVCQGAKKVATVAVNVVKAEAKKIFETGKKIFNNLKGHIIKNKSVQLN